MRSLKVAVGVVLLAALTGCGVQMGNMKLGLLEGWNQPTTNQKTVETQAPAATTIVTPK